MSERIGIKKTITAATLVGISALAACGNQAHAESGFRGGCDRFGVYARNRWDPLGTAIRPEPNILSPEIGSYGGDKVIAVNGWFHYGNVVYPTNSAPWRSNIWYHLADRSGYVDFAGVRGAPTVPDPTGRANGGEPALTPANCEGAYTP